VTSLKSAQWQKDCDLLATQRLDEKEGFAGFVLRMRQAGIVDHALTAALEATPRTLFTPYSFADAAYSPRMIPIECGSFLEGIDLAARLLFRLDLKAGQRVLEIGTGSGFTAAVIARLVDRVLTIDRYRTLVRLADERFARLAIVNVAARVADGRMGVRGEGTFDRILVTGAFESIPRHFADLLVSDGIMLAPLMREDGERMMVRFHKIGSRFEREDLFAVPYEPLQADVALAR